MRVDEVAIREFLHTSYPRLVAAVALTSGSRPAAEDAGQEGVPRAWGGSGEGGGMGWLGEGRGDRRAGGMGDHGGAEPGTERAPPDPIRTSSAGSAAHSGARRAADGRPPRRRPGRGRG